MICSLNHPSAAQPETVNTVTHLIRQERLGRGWGKGLGDYSPPRVHPLRAVERGYQKTQAPIPRGRWEGAHSQFTPTSPLAQHGSSGCRLWQRCGRPWTFTEGLLSARPCAGQSSSCLLILFSQQHCRVLIFIKHLLYACHFTYIIGFHFSKSPRKQGLVLHPLYKGGNGAFQSIIGSFVDLFSKGVLHAHPVPGTVLSAKDMMIRR